MEGTIAFFIFVICVVLIVIQFAIAIAISRAAERKGRSKRAFFWLSLLVNWVVMLIIVVTISDDSSSKKTISKRADTEDFGATQVHCPFCKESIRADAVVCKHCTSAVEPQDLKLKTEYQNQQKKLEAERAQQQNILNEQNEEALQLKQQKTLERKTKAKNLLTSKKILIPGVLIVLVIGASITFISVNNQISQQANSAAERKQILENNKKIRESKNTAKNEELAEVHKNWGLLVELCQNRADDPSNFQINSTNDQIVITGFDSNGDGGHLLACVEGNLKTNLYTNEDFRNIPTDFGYSIDYSVERDGISSIAVKSVTLVKK